MIGYTGIPFLIQIHLIFVYAWFFCTVIGWICIAQAVEPTEFRWMRKILLSASIIVLLSPLSTVIINAVSSTGTCIHCRLQSTVWCWDRARPFWMRYDFS